MFTVDKQGAAFKLFKTQATKKRAEQFSIEFWDKMGDWMPDWHGAFELYKKNGSDWKKVDASEFSRSSSRKEAWKDMPQAAIAWLQEQPEFDAEIFKKITGIDVHAEKEDMVDIDGREFSKSTVKEALKSYLQ